MIRTLIERYKRLTANEVVGLWLAIWWVINLIVAGASELANDEAYYHMFAQNLAWGYFDHPPMTALLVWLGEHIFCGELGVRFFFTLMQPLYLYIFWSVIRDSSSKAAEQLTREDGELYAMITSSMLILQLYGLVAVPDGPLMFFTALFLLMFKCFTQSKRWAWLGMGITLGLLALSKYHGALVLTFALLANIKWLLQNPKKIAELALSGVIALAIITPHLIWQYHHDWVSFTYHLMDRNKAFAFGNVTEYIINMLVVFSPFFVPLWVQAMRKVKSTTPLTRLLKFYPVAFFIFFGASTVRGHVQPQWTIVATYGLIWLLWCYTLNHTRTRAYVMRMGWFTNALIIIVKFVLIFNPISLRAELFNNQSSYDQIAEAANNRPLIVETSYTKAAKYNFYTGEQAYCQSSARHRTSQWQFRNDDDSFINKEVIIEVSPENYTQREQAEKIKSIELTNGKMFHYVEEPQFRPVRRVSIEVEEFNMPQSVSQNTPLSAKLKIANPYPYDIEIDGKCNSLVICWRWPTAQCSYFPLADGFTIPAGGSADIACEFVIPNAEQLPAQRYKVGFAIQHRYIPTWYNSELFTTEITNN